MEILSKIQTQSKSQKVVKPLYATLVQQKTVVYSHSKEILKMVQEDSSTDKHGSSMFFKDCEFVCPSPVLCPEDLQLAMLDMSSDP